MQAGPKHVVVIRDVELIRAERRVLLCRVRGRWFWLPRGQVGWNTLKPRALGDVAIPLWLARDHGLT